jgi:hypothetical protein
MRTSVHAAPKAAPPTNRKRPVLVTIAVVSIGAAIALALASPALRNAVGRDDGGPHVVVSLSPDPDSRLQAEERLAAIPGIVWVDQTTSDDMVVMGLEPELGWHLADARTLVLGEGAGLDSVRRQALEIGGVHGIAVRDGDHVRWTLPGSEGGTVFLRAGKVALVEALTTWVWPVLLFAGVALAALALAGPRRIRGLDGLG